MPVFSATQSLIEAPTARDRQFAHNVSWNLLGAGVPMIVALFSIPILIRTLGATRFGALTMMTPILGYASILDLGLSRAVTKLIADRMACGRSAEVPELFWTGAVATLGCGLVFGCVLAALAPWLARRVLNIPPEIQTEVRQALYLVALGLIVAVSTNAFRGTLEALGRFDLSNAVRTMTGVILVAGPLAVLPFSHSLAAIVAVLVAGRALAWLAQLVFCLRHVTGAGVVCPRRRHLAVLTSFGGWVTVSNAVGQLLFYCDRFVVGRLLSMSAVAYLTTPQEVTSQLLVIPNAICGVLFPLFVKDFARGPGDALERMKQGGRYVFLLIFPVCFVLSTFSRLVMTLWLGSQFAQRSAGITSWCALALLFSATGLVPYAVIQAAHRPDIPSKVYLSEAGIYVLLLWWLIKMRGIQGAALSFVARIVFEAIVFWAAAGKCPRTPWPPHSEEKSVPRPSVVARGSQERLLPGASTLAPYLATLLGIPAILLLAGGFAHWGGMGQAALGAAALGNWMLVLSQAGLPGRALARAGARA